MNWYITLLAERHEVVCYGCNEFQHIDTSEWMEKRTSPAHWRCQECREAGNVYDEDRYVKPNDRGVADEFLMRSTR